MPKATNTFNTLSASASPPPTIAGQPCTARRGLLAGLAGIGAVTLAGASLAGAAPAQAASGDDAELLATIAAFDALEREIKATYDGCGDTIEAEVAADLVRMPLKARQAPLLSRICALRAVTVQGWQARARSLMLWDGDQDIFAVSEDDLNGYWDDRMLAALFRDLVGSGEA